MKKLLAIVASALTLGAFANSAADPVITADTSAVDPDTTCSVMADNEKVFDFATNGGVMAIQIDEKYVGRRVCLAVDGEEITESTTAQMGAANAKLGALKLAGEVNDQVVWSNFATTGEKTSWFTKGNNQCTFTLAAKDDCPIGATVTISEVRFASNAGRTWADTITINSVTSASKTTGDSGLDDFTEAEIYAFTEGVDVVVGTTYQLGTSGNIQLTGSIPTAGFQNPVFIPGLTSPHTEKTAALCEVTATIKSLPARDPIAFTFDATTQTWNEELPEEFMNGDTIVYTGTGDATLSSNVTVPLTVGAGVNLSIADGVTISVAMTFEAGSTITVASGTATISGAIAQGVVKKLGEGELVLSGDNSFTKLEVAEGTVKNGNTSNGKGLGAYNGSGDCDNLSLITVAEGAKLDVVNIATQGYGACYRVELAGELTNSGIDTQGGWRQLSKITVTGDNAKITGNTYYLLGSGYAATKLELGEHTLEVALNTDKIFHLRTTTISGTGTIKITSGQLHVTTGTSLADETDITVLVAEGASFDDGLSIFSEENVKPLDSVNNKIVKDGCVYSAAARDVATTIYVKNKEHNQFQNANGESIKMISGDVVSFKAGIYPGTERWKIVLDEAIAGHEVEIDFPVGSAAAQATINSDDLTGKTVTITDTTVLFLRSTTVTVGNGTNIKGKGSIHFEGNTLKVTGDAVISAGITTKQNCLGTIKIAEDASLTTAEIKNESITITTDVEGSHVEYQNGAYVVVEDSSEIPGEELIDNEEKEAYKSWAETNGVTAETTTDHDTLAIAFHLDANKGDTYDTIEDAAQAKVEELVAKIDCSKLAGEDGLNAALETLNAELDAKGLVASLKPVELEGASESTKLYQLVITLKTQN